MSSPRPIEIIGGGLAGLSLGLALRKEDVPVVIFDAGDYPRHRVCGEFITGLGSETIARLGLGPLLEDALSHREVAWFLGERRTRIQRLPVPALGLSRYALDSRLATAFTAAGGQLRTRTRVADLTGQPGRVFANGRRRGKSPWIGLKFHARRLPLERELELHLGDQAYVGLSRIENGAVNVCGLFKRRALATAGPQLLLDYLQASGLRSLSERLTAAAIDPESVCAVAALCFDRRSTSAAGSVRIGDCCAMIPPFTGNGMAMAFQSAEAALDPLLDFARDGRGWSEICRAIDSALRRRFRLRLASADLVHPFLLRPPRQRWLAALSRARLVPFGPLYSTLH